MTPPILREPLSLAATPKAWPPGLECIVDYNNSAVVLNDLRRVDRIVLTGIGGLSGPDLQASAEKNPDRDGETPQDATYGGRTITLRGYVESLNRDRMRALYSYLLDGFDTLAEAPLWFRWMDWRDQFVDSLSINDYAFDAGTGTLQIASDGTGLQPTSTANKQLRVSPLKADGTVPTRFGYGDGEAIVKFRAGTALTGLAVGPEFRRASSTVKLRVIYEKATDTIRLYKVNTATTQLASIAATGLVVGTDYWLRVRAEGVNISYSLWSTYPPDVGGTALFSGTFALTGGDIALYPSTDTGMSWGLYWTPNSTTDRVGLLDVGALNPGDPIVNCRKSVQLEGDETQADFGWRRDFMLTLRASDARMISRKPTFVTFTPPGTPTSQIYYAVNLTNYGRSPADMLVRFNFLQVRPHIYVPSNGKTLGVSSEIVSGGENYLELDTNNRTIVSPVGLRYHLLSNDTTWPQLPRGTNELRIVADRLDDFRDATPASVLNGRTSIYSLGTWTTSGATTDFTVQNSVLLNPSGSGDQPVTRATISDTGNGRIGFLSANNYVNAKIEVPIRFTTAFNASVPVRMSILIRYVDASNYAFVSLYRHSGGDVTYYIKAYKVIAAAAPLEIQSLNVLPYPLPNINTWYILSVTMRANGRLNLELRDYTTGSIVVSNSTLYGDIDTATSWLSVDSALVTAGTLATGKIGLLDYNSSTTAITRYYGEVRVTSAIDQGTIDVTYRSSSR